MLQKTTFLNLPFKKIIIHILTNVSEGKFIGDRNQALGIQNALKERYATFHLPYESYEWDVKEIGKLASSLEKNEEAVSVVIGIGDHGLTALRSLKHNSLIKDNFFSLWASHQLFKELQVSAQCLDIIALPTHVVTEEIIQLLKNTNTKLIQTVGVAHNVIPESLQEKRMEWQDRIPAAERYIGVFLGGDAPEPNGNIRYFTAEEAQLMGKYIGERAQAIGATLLITNSPRTGQYDPKTGKNVTVHQGAELDKTTESFMAGIAQSGTKGYLFDFQFGKASAYPALLGALQQTPGSVAFVTGDSTSMLSEIADSLANGSVYAVTINSMNSAHHAHVKAAHQNGYVHLISLNKEANTIQEFPLVTLQNTKPLAAASIIAKHTFEYISASFKMSARQL